MKTNIMQGTLGVCLMLLGTTLGAREVVGMMNSARDLRAGAGESECIEIVDNTASNCTKKNTNGAPNACTESTLGADYTTCDGERGKKKIPGEGLVGSATQINETCKGVEYECLRTFDPQNNSYNYSWTAAGPGQCGTKTGVETTAAPGGATPCTPIPTPVPPKQ